METPALSELFPLFQAAEPETLEWLMSVADESRFAAGETVLGEETWGNAVHFIQSGWLQVRRWQGERVATQEILGRGEFIGEAAVLDEPPRATEAIALDEVRTFEISAQRFLQALFKDSQLHHKLLQHVVRRLRQTRSLLYLHHQPAPVRLAHAIATLAEEYGKPTEEGMEILTLPEQVWADLAGLELEQARQLLAKWQSKGWLDVGERVTCVTNLKQLGHLIGGL